MESVKQTGLTKLGAFLSKKDVLDTCLKLCIAILLLLCIFSRVCIYLFPKDLILDEVSLYNGINEQGWLALLQGKLPYQQSAPLFFVLLIKFIITHVGHGSAYLHFFPFFCSLLSILTLFLLSRKIGDIFYVFSTLLLFSFCLTATYYSGEVKQYSTELFISLVILYVMTESLKTGNQNFFSLKYIFFYCVCILFSSSAVLFLAGILGARILIAWRRHALRAVVGNWWKILLFLAFIACYYFFFLQAGNSEGMRRYWKPYFIPLGWGEFWRYWQTTGIQIFYALFHPTHLAVMIFLGLVCGCPLLWCKGKDLFLLISMPVAVTIAANFFFYPPGTGGVLGGRLLLFLLPNAILVASWFYAWILRRLAALLSPTREYPDRAWRLVVYAGRPFFLCLLFVLVGATALANARYLYTKAYYRQQISELVQIFRCNATPDSLNLVYGPAERAYRYYQQDAPKMKIEVLPWDFAPVKIRLKDLPGNKRVLLLISHYWRIGERGLREIEDIFTAQGREYVKIPARGSVLYILPKLQ